PAGSPGRTPTTVASAWPLLLPTSEDKEKSGVSKSEASVKPSTPFMEKATKVGTVSVTPSKEPEQKKLLKTPDQKRQTIVDEGEELFKRPP
ncbi:hypothetical protein PMAYCL1PPCAC_11751, partial [Pristionchus mayeri]